MPDCFSLTPLLRLSLVYYLCLLSQFPTCTISINVHEIKINSSWLKSTAAALVLDPSQEPVDHPAGKAGSFWTCMVVDSSAEQEIPGVWCVGSGEQLIFRDMGSWLYTWETARSIISGWSWLSLTPDASLAHPFPAETCLSKLPSTGISIRKIQLFHCPPYKFFLSSNTLI